MIVGAVVIMASRHFSQVSIGGSIPPSSTNIIGYVAVALHRRETTGGYFYYGDFRTS